VRTSTIVMVGFAVLFGLLAVFLAQTWLNNQAELRMRSLEAQKKPDAPAHTVVVASKALRFGDELGAASLREVPWPQGALPAGAFARIAELTAGKRVVVLPMNENEAVLASKITGPGQRATLSAVLGEGMKAVTIRVNDVEGVAGFVLPGDHVDVVLTRQIDKETATNDVVIENARVLAVDQSADSMSFKPSVVKAVTLEVEVAAAQKLALASAVGTLSLLLRKAGEMSADNSRRVTLADLGRAFASLRDTHAVTVSVTRGFKREHESFKRDTYSVPVERAGAQAAIRSEQGLAHD
jgi:pilus assembly protein CpaB